MSVIGFVLVCLYCSHRPKSNSEPELCFLDNHFLGVVLLDWSTFLAMGNDSEGILGLATFGDHSPFFYRRRVILGAG